MKTIRRESRLVACALAAVVAACLSSVAAASDEGCAAAVNRVRNALTWEGYFLKNATQVACQVASLPPESRAGRAEAISAGAQQNLENAKRETAAAYAAAGSCDVSGERRPELIVPKVDFNLYSACELRARAAEQEVITRPGSDDAAHAAARARYQAARNSCDRLLAEVDCAAIRIKDEPPPVIETPIVTAPEDMKPECRAVYVRFRTAENDLERAQKYQDFIRPNYSAAGPKGSEILKASIASSAKARQARDRAKEELAACEGKTETADTPKPGAPKPVRACDAGARAAFAGMSGSWKSIAIGPNITIGGSCEEATATEKWAEYCERPDATYNATLKRYEARFVGSVQGASLSLVPAKDSTDTRSGSCSVNAEGTLTCTGIPCGISARKR